MVATARLFYVWDFTLKNWINAMRAIALLFALIVCACPLFSASAQNVSVAMDLDDYALYAITSSILSFETVHDRKQAFADRNVKLWA